MVVFLHQLLHSYVARVWNSDEIEFMVKQKVDDDEKNIFNADMFHFAQFSTHFFPNCEFAM